VACYHNETDPNCAFALTVIILFFFFSIGAITVSFFAYRIFKATALNGAGAGANFGGGLLQGMGGAANRGANNADNEAPPR
jgi:hypothetical protein